MAATILGQAGYLVNVAGDAQGALASALKAPPDVDSLDGHLARGRRQAVVGAPAFTARMAHLTRSSSRRPVRRRRRDPRRRARRPACAKPFRGRGARARGAGRAGARTATGDRRRRARRPRPSPSTPTETSAGHRPLSALRGVLGEIGLSACWSCSRWSASRASCSSSADAATARLFLRKGHVIRAEIDDASRCQARQRSTRR